MRKLTRKDKVLLLSLFLALVLMFMPYSIPQKTMHTSGNEMEVIVTDVYAYLSRISLNYSGFIPFISWLACVAAVMLFFIIRSGRKKGNKLDICFFAAIFLSFAASAAAFFIFKTLLSGIITAVLLASCVLHVTGQLA